MTNYFTASMTTAEMIEIIEETIDFNLNALTNADMITYVNACDAWDARYSAEMIEIMAERTGISFADYSEETHGDDYYEDFAEDVIAAAAAIK